MTSTNPEPAAGGTRAGVQLDAELTALLQLTDQLGHHVEHRAATRLLAHMDHHRIEHYDTGTSHAVPRGHDADTALITLVAMMPTRIFSWHPTSSTYRLTRAALATHLKTKPSPIVAAIEVLTITRAGHTPAIHTFINGAPIAARCYTLDTQTGQLSGQHAAAPCRAAQAAITAATTA